MGQSKSKSNSYEAKHCTPVGLYPTCEWDKKTLRKLVCDKKLAPISVGRDDDVPGEDLDDCPICFLYYPKGLNRTACCGQEICSECVLQVKKPSTPRPPCPFCNAKNLTTVFRGPKTAAERKEEESEQQKVLLAKARMRKEQEEQRVKEMEERRQSQVMEVKQEEEEEEAQGEGAAPAPPPPVDVGEVEQVKNEARRQDDALDAVVAGVWDFNLSDEDAAEPEGQPLPSASVLPPPPPPPQQPAGAMNFSDIQRLLGDMGEDQLEELMLREAIRISLLES